MQWQHNNKDAMEGRKGTDREEGGNLKRIPFPFRIIDFTCFTVCMRRKMLMNGFVYCITLDEWKKSNNKKKDERHIFNMSGSFLLLLLLLFLHGEITSDIFSIMHFLL
jgi:hypothetical protein